MQGDWVSEDWIPEPQKHLKKTKSQQDWGLLISGILPRHDRNSIADNSYVMLGSTQLVPRKGKGKEKGNTMQAQKHVSERMFSISSQFFFI